LRLGTHGLHGTLSATTRHQGHGARAVYRWTRRRDRAEVTANRRLGVSACSGKWSEQQTHHHPASNARLHPAPPLRPAGKRRRGKQRPAPPRPQARSQGHRVAGTSCSASCLLVSNLLHLSPPPPKAALETVPKASTQKGYRWECREARNQELCAGEDHKQLTPPASRAVPYSESSFCVCIPVIGSLPHGESPGLIIIRTFQIR
jgi:hypothetical protein